MSERSENVLKEELVALEKMSAVAEERGFEHLEKYASLQADACVLRTYTEASADPAVHLAQCQFYRGQGNVWAALSSMRANVASRIADVRQQLARIRKEDVDGNVGDAG